MCVSEYESVCGGGGGGRGSELEIGECDTQIM